MKGFRHGRGIKMVFMGGGVFLLAVLLPAQETASKRSFLGAGYFMLGMSRLAPDDLNASLESAGYPEFPGKMLTSGGGGHVVMGRLVLGLEGHTLRSRRFEGDSFTNSLSASCGFFNAGYVVHRSRSLNVFPLIGLGLGKINLTIADAEPLSFDDVIADPARESRLSTSGFLLNLALGADWFIGLGGDGRNRGGLLIGIRAGCTLAPVNSGWESGPVEIEGGPRTTVTGPYIRLIIGGGGRSF